MEWALTVAVIVVMFVGAANWRMRAMKRQEDNVRVQKRRIGTN
ncbi:MAG: hypothetical protein OXI16_08795 [Chloroflexota bacterium]|nr:hypothetical protein [Chloroflexota bacterium]MDE2687575.1 hypothetical protein [Chloroflexota bacterium]